MRKGTSFIAVMCAVLIFAVGYQAMALRSPATGTIRRSILLKFKPAATQDEIRRVLEGVKANVGSIKGTSNIIAGAQINDGTAFRYGVSMDFDGAESLAAYNRDEGHKKLHEQFVHLIEEAQITDILGH
ncbi:MAG: Dabb family protein [Acidobacteria bacterium]|nr:Dabb family protein [Acidobacteriota bacterium]